MYFDSIFMWIIISIRHKLGGLLVFLFIKEIFGEATLHRSFLVGCHELLHFVASFREFWSQSEIEVNGIFVVLDRRGG